MTWLILECFKENDNACKYIVDGNPSVSCEKNCQSSAELGIGQENL